MNNTLANSHIILTFWNQVSFSVPYTANTPSCNSLHDLLEDVARTPHKTTLFTVIPLKLDVSILFPETISSHLGQRAHSLPYLGLEVKINEYISRKKSGCKSYL